MNLTAKEKLEKVRDLRPIDDVFFEVLAANPAVCQEILRVIMEDNLLVVSDVIVQASEQNIYGRSVRLDARYVRWVTAQNVISRCSVLIMMII